MTETSSPVQLLHHGAAANSTNQSVFWYQDDHGDSRLLYASHRTLSFGRRVPRLVAGRTEQVWSIQETLRCSVEGSGVTCLVQTTAGRGIVCGFDNGTISLWSRTSGSDWKEHVLFEMDEKRSITVVSALQVARDRIVVLAGSSSGVVALDVFYRDGEWSVPKDRTVFLMHAPVSSVQVIEHKDPMDSLLMIAGTASHRHNKIHVWRQSRTGIQAPSYCGALLGHEDWVSCFSWRKEDNTMDSCLLASGSQDNKIRLWKFMTRIDHAANTANASPELQKADSYDAEGSDDSEEDPYLDLEEEGESRLEIRCEKSTTSVFLDALLVGHEAAVTSVEWHPKPKSVYGQDMVLISSSMDRSILFWSPSVGGIWAPLTRVGSAGGILGGSVGSSLLGYCRAVIEPLEGHCLVGHAFGGALHVWSLEGNIFFDPDVRPSEHVAAQRVLSWVASPGITGHFAGVTDLSWETSGGHYLLTAGKDQTCRLWVPLDQHNDSGEKQNDAVWVELARPQVHGYDLSAVTSVSLSQHLHRIVSGADEKEIRVFDAPQATLRLLNAVSSRELPPDAMTSRVERAYIPSLGLTNKATAADGAEEDADEITVQGEPLGSRLPLERELGSESIWPEVLKLFGHSTELYCLTSTCEARTAGHFTVGDTLVASSAKARDAEAAVIRLWDLNSSNCIQRLTGGHKSTVTTMSFSPDGQYLVSSGKDRRICLWKRDATAKQFQLLCAQDVAHKRIIWSVHVCPLDATLFASGSRDGCVRIWMVQAGTTDGHFANLCSFAPVHLVDGKPDAVTAVSFAPRRLRDTSSLVLAIGLESGRLEIWKVLVNKEQITAIPELFYAFPQSLCHSDHVTKLAWQPCTDAGSVGKHVLASCSLDRGCRLFTVDLDS